MPRTEWKLMEGWEFALQKCKAHSPESRPEIMFKREEFPGLIKELRFERVNLPHDWAVDAPFDRNMEQGMAQGFRDRWGVGFYRRSLTLSDKKDGYRYYLEFGGIYENSDIWVNGGHVGGRKYGYSTFRLDVTDRIRQGDNELLVRADNSTSPVDRWYSGCGIYRTVKLIETEEKHLDPWDIIVHTGFDGKDALVEVDTGTTETVSGLLRHGSGEGIQAFGEEGRLFFRVKEACLWSAENPALYELTVRLERQGRTADEVTRRIGLREVCFDKESGMSVNGKPVTLRGVCLHQEAGCLGIAVTPEIWRERLLMLKEMGCNAIRAAHHTFAEEFLDLCDELGFYVYEECFDKWKGGLYGRYFDSEWQADVDAMVKRDRNRPCIVIWGVGNEVENQGQASMLSILERLSDYVRTLDHTRPVTYAMNPHFKRESQVDLAKIKDIQQFVDEVSDTEIYDAGERVERIARIAKLVDIISCNYQEQWYDLIHKAIPDKLILGTEVYEYFKGHSEQMQNFTEELPALVPEEKKFCIGSFIWTGYDYLGESMGYPAKGWSGAPIHTNNEPRPVYHILKSHWTQEPMIHFSVMDYSLPDEGVKEHWDSPMYADHWHFPQFHKTVIPYIVATNCEEAVLYLNGKKLYLPKPSACKNGMITGFLPWQPGRVEAVGYQGGLEVCRHVTVTPGEAVKLGFDCEEQEICLPPAGGEEAKRHLLLTVRALDEEGNPCFRESAKISFRAEGPAKVLAVDNGDICSNEPYNPYGTDRSDGTGKSVCAGGSFGSCRGSFVHLYHGCASVMLEFNGTAGRVSVWADGMGLRSGQAVIYVNILNAR